MPWLRALLVRLGRYGGLEKIEREIDEEVRFHLDMRTAANVAAGMSEKAAREEALRRFGPVRTIRVEGSRILAGAPPPRRPGHFLDAILQDLGFALRGAARHPGFALAAVVVLSLGLSISTAVFTYANGFFQPFPGVDPDRLARVFRVSADNPYTSLSYPDYLDLAATGGDSFEGVAANQAGFAASVRHEHLTEVVFGQAVTGSYFSLLGIGTSLGRGLTTNDDRREAPPDVVISHRYWQRRFGGDDGIVGRILYLNNNPYTMVGVTAPDFLGSTSAIRPDIWLPIEQFRIVYWRGSAVATDRELPLLDVYVRLRKGATMDQAEAELDAVAAGLDATHPLKEERRDLRLAAATWIDPTSRLAEMPTTRLMLAAAAALLLLACANTANLLLSATTRRRQEMAMRSALGASPKRLLQQLLTENILLTGIAGGLAAALAGPASSRLGSYFARPSVWGLNVPREVAVDLRVFGFVFALSVSTGLAVGMLPALQASRRNLVDALKAGGQTWMKGPRSPFGRRAWGIRDILVSAQVALSVVLLILSGLVLRTLDSVGDIDPGFDVDHLVASFMSTSSTDIPAEDREVFYRQLAERFETKSWVRRATLAAQAPLSPHPSTNLRLEDEDSPVPLTYAMVVPGFFEAVGIEVLQGRSFLPTDTVDAVGVAVVNSTLARRFFGRGDPVGRRLWWPGAGGGSDRPYEIVGVVRDQKVQDLLAEHEPVVYFSYPQHYYTPGNALLLSTSIAPRAAVPLLEEELRAVDARLALVNALPYSDVVRGFTYAQRMNAELFSLVALFGLVLAAVGIFSVLSLAVGQRTREIGVRMAVGAYRRDIARLVAGRVLGAVTLGIGVGLIASLLMTRLVRGLLFGVEPTDPLAIALGIGVLLAAALVAVLLPTRRAVTVDPLTSLRVE
jgi:predicted permease